MCRSVALPVRVNALIWTSFITILSANAQSVRQCSFANEGFRPRQNSSTRMTDETATLYIPVVFHVVYSQESQNISNEQIYSQLKVINEDFVRKNGDTVYTLTEFRSVAANARIQFYLAETEGIRGITRTATTHGPFHNNDLHLSAQGGKDAWDTEKYLNVWIANLAPGIFGYAGSPDAPGFTDGVAVHYQYFGRHKNALAPYNLGRTLTHEIGHWLGLQHPWGAGGCGSDDGLTDTPSQEGPTFGCVLNQSSCGSLNMVQNFMNTSEDPCMNLFTRQQVDLMRSTLTTLRPTVFSDEEVVTGTDSEIKKVVATLYPNPVTHQPFVYVNAPDNASCTARISITDLRGFEITHYEIPEFKDGAPLSLEGLSNGMYIARISSDRVNFSTKIYLNIH